MYPVKIVSQFKVTCEEKAICRDYYTLSATDHFASEHHDAFICRLHGISSTLLTALLSKVRVYRSDIACKDCKQLFLLTKPNQRFPNQAFSWYCQGCQDFQSNRPAKSQGVVDDDFAF